MNNSYSQGASLDSRQDLLASAEVWQVFVILSVLLVFIIWILVDFLSYEYPYFSQSNKEVYINQNLSPEQLRQVNLALNSADDIYAQQQAIEQIDWIAKAELSRKISRDNNLLLIDIQKSQKLARLEDGSFVFAQVPNNLAEDYPVALLSLERGESYDAYEPDKLSADIIKQLARLADVLRSHQMQATEYLLQGDGYLEVRLEDGLSIRLGAREHSKRISRLDDFLNFYQGSNEGLAKRNSKDAARFGTDLALNIRTIDLRHQGGLAVLYR